MYNQMLSHYQEHLFKLQLETDDLAQTLNGHELIQSAPGIEDKIAETNLSEIGEINQFEHLKQPTAYAVVDA